MRQRIINVLINIIGLLNKGKRKPTSQQQDFCNLIADKRFIQATMPNGEIIPGQIDLTIKQPFNTSGFAIVECTFFVHFDNIIK